jgi:hypothetical protein
MNLGTYAGSFATSPGLASGNNAGSFATSPCLSRESGMSEARTTSGT